MAKMPVVKGKLPKICDIQCHKKGHFVTFIVTFFGK